VDPTGLLKDVLKDLYKWNRDRRLAVDVADRIVGQVHRSAEKFRMTFQAFTARPNADPTVIIEAYHDLENAIEEVWRDKVLVKCIERGKRPLNYYTPPGAIPNNQRPPINELVERDLGRALWHIGNSARRMLEYVGVPATTGPGLSANPHSDLIEADGYFRATWRKMAPLSVDRKYYAP